MLKLFVVLAAGIALGRLLSGRCLGFVPRAVTATVWLLLFLLGVEVGADPAVTGSLATLGCTALVLCAGSVAGSIAAAWVLWRRVRRADGASEAAAAAPQACGADGGSTAAVLRGSLVIVGFFAAGCVAGAWRLVPFAATASQASGWVLCLLMGGVGVTLGHDRTLWERVRRLDRRLALLPLATAAGTLLGAALLSPLLRGVSLTDALAVGSGFAYYSLSSVFIADLRSVELGTVALLCNILRELFTLLFAPLVARRFGPLAAVSIGGATTMDTTLPIVARAAGPQFVVVAIFHGCVLDFSVPWLVTLFCSL